MFKLLTGCQAYTSFAMQSLLLFILLQIFDVIFIFKRCWFKKNWRAATAKIFCSTMTCFCVSQVLEFKMMQQIFWFFVLSDAVQAIAGYMYI